MIRCLPLLLLLGCPAPHDDDAPANPDAPATGAWDGAVGGAPVPGEGPRAVWVAVTPGAAMAIGPSGNVEETALMGVELDASVLVWATDLPDPCPALAAWQDGVNDANSALLEGDTAAWQAALEAGSDALPEAFTSVAVGLAAEEAAGIAGGAWPITPEASGETPDGWRAGATLAERQVARPDWQAVMSGGADLGEYFAASTVTEGAAATDGVADDGTLALTVEATFDDGGALTLDVTAARCPALEAALAELHGEPSTL